MPRKDSKAAQLRVAARWVEFRALAKWQWYVAREREPDPGMYEPDAEFEPIIDEFARFTINEPPTLSEIQERLARLPADELRTLAEHAQRKAHLFRPGRPDRDYGVLNKAIEARPAGTSIRARSQHLAASEPGRGPKPATMRRRFYRQKKSTAGE